MGILSYRNVVIIITIVLLVGASVIQGISRNTETTVLINIVDKLNQNIFTFYLTVNQLF